MLIAATAPAAAQTFPARPITMVIPFAAGGAQDVLGRLMAQRMSEILGQQIVIENIGGAGGMNGSKRVADAAPDGYTMGIGSVGTHAHNQSLYKKPRYDAVADFTPRRADRRDAGHARHAQGSAAEQSAGVRRLRESASGKDAIRFAAAPDRPRMSAAWCSTTSSGSKSPTCPIADRPWRPRICSPAASTTCANSSCRREPQIRAGNIKGIANLSKERSPIMPDLPTAFEQGIDVQAYAWTALFLPKGAPDGIVQTLNKAALQSIHTPAVRERILESGSSVVSDERTTPQYLAAFLKSEIDRWAAPIKASGISMD